MTTPLLVRFPTDRDNSLSDPTQVIDLRRPEKIVLKPYFTRNVVCRANPVVIKNRTLNEVWKAIFDFDTYPKWNSYQRTMRIDDRDNVIMKVNMKWISDGEEEMPDPATCQDVKEKIFLRDDARKILIYGFSSTLNVACSMRVIYIEPSGRDVVYHSYVVLGGVLSLILDYFYKDLVTQGFERASQGFARFLNGSSNSSGGEGVASGSARGVRDGKRKRSRSSSGSDSSGAKQELAKM